MASGFPAGHRYPLLGRSVRLAFSFGYPSLDMSLWPGASPWPGRAEILYPAFPVYTTRAVIRTLWERRIRARIIWGKNCNTINSRVTLRGTPIVEVAKLDPIAEPERIQVDSLMVRA